MNAVVIQNVMIAMRDGVQLATDIYKPETDGKYPVILTRVPYNKSLSYPGMPGPPLFLQLNWDMERIIDAGYIVVAQDCRGTYASDGHFEPFANEVNDGRDTLEWIASQTWCDGNIGMFGVSYQGITQWTAARGAPPELKAIAPSQAPDPFYPYQGGALTLSIAADWTATQGAVIEVAHRLSRGEATPEELQAVMELENDLRALCATLPTSQIPLFDKYSPYYADWLGHPEPGTYWQSNSAEGTIEQIKVPALIIGGWYDYFLLNDLANYKQMRTKAGSELARKQTQIFIGPWPHGMFWNYIPGRDYNIPADQQEIDLTAIQVRWYNHWLKGVENRLEQDKPVHIFVLGADTWRAEEEWPLPDTIYRPYYLHSNGHANTRNGDGLLSTEPPAAEPEDVYTYDPNNPVPSLSPATFLMEETRVHNQRELEMRPDVVCFTTAPLEKSVEVVGPIELVLYASSSARDTDFTGKLVDVYPNGRAEQLVEGILRARYRDSFTNPTPIEPEQIYELHIDLAATANVFLTGHRIRLEVSSSNFPRFDRNSNTGGTISTETAQDFIIATNRIHHTTAHPSHLILPIIERV